MLNKKKSIPFLLKLLALWWENPARKGNTKQNYSLSLDQWEIEKGDSLLGTFWGVGSMKNNT